LELADYEKLTHTVTGNAQSLHDSLFGESAACQCMVAEADGAIVGYALSFFTYSTFRTQKGCWLEDLYVTPTHRRRGLGKLMLKFLIEESGRSGLGRLEWSVLDWNQSAIDFYAHLGAHVLPDWRICRASLEL